MVIRIWGPFEWNQVHFGCILMCCLTFWFIGWTVDLSDWSLCGLKLIWFKWTLPAPLNSTWWCTCSMQTRDAVVPRVLKRASTLSWQPLSRPANAPFPNISNQTHVDLNNTLPFKQICIAWFTAINFFLKCKCIWIVNINVSNVMSSNK